MNNNAAAILRALIVYAFCVPVAIVAGYMLTNPMGLSTWLSGGLLLLLLCAPILLRWHHILLVFSLNFSMLLFFLPGDPRLGMLMLALSLGISLLQRTLNKDMRFIHAPQITLPLICLAAVVLFTAKMTGGIGLHSMGSEVWGGKKYMYVFYGVLIYFALSAQRIPSDRARLYVALYFLGFCANVIGDLVAVMPPSLDFIFAFFPPNRYAFTYGDVRFAGVAMTASGLFYLMLARYGVGGIFLAGKLWRPVALALFFTLTLFGGFRSLVIGCLLVFAFQFFLERMHRTRLMPLFLFFGIAAAVAIVPLADQLPFTFQRSLAFLPLPISAAAKQDARASEDWRLQLWKSLLPQIPGHLLLGKGYAMTAEDFESANIAWNNASLDESAQAVAGDYHSGPLSVIIPFGIWGALAFLWFLGAGIWALRNNYRYGDPSLNNVNALLFTMFATKALAFMVVFGSLEGDMQTFAAILGLSVSLNGGIRRPARAPAGQAAEARPAPAPARPRLQPAFQR